MTSAEYSLRGDRNIEYAFAKSNTPAGNGKRLLDVGPGARVKLGRWARGQRGWSVTAVDILETVNAPGISWVTGDLNHLKFDPGYFAFILNVSSIEHFGVPGRYGITELDADADLRAMRRMRKWLAEDGIMVVTLPIGSEEVIFAPYHRVYNNERLTRLFSGYTVAKQEFWNKQGGNNDKFLPCSDGSAFSTIATLSPHHYYAIGGFVLRKNMEK